ncbi:MAG TPA: nuclear transport factor 2 family protein [Blastocatellia bacterium]|nr:nuclear transport factor 2 family protein [Blastocatellia bacterium]
MKQTEASDLDREFADLMREWFESIRRRDGEWFERVMDDDWRYVMNDGAVKDKRWYISSLQMPFDSGPTAVIHEVATRVYGDVVIAVGHYSVSGVYQGQDLSSNTRFTAVWRRADDRWQALSHHATRIAE